MSSESLLENVARHETALMKELDLAREDARLVVDAAHADGAAYLQDAAARLDGEIGEMRRLAARSREEVRVSIEQAATAEVQRIRDESSSRTGDVRQELLARVVPSAV